METAVTTMVMTAMTETCASPTTMLGASTKAGTTLASAPKTSWAPFSRKYETPIAVMRIESLGALRRGA